MEAEVAKAKREIECANDKCRLKFAVPEEKLGWRMPCPHCGTMTEIPADLPVKQELLLVKSVSGSS